MQRGRTALAVTALSLLTACAPEVLPHPVRASDQVDGVPAERVIELVPRTPHLATYPCGAQCHDSRAADPRPRELSTFHAGRVVEHGPALDWCQRCHSIDDPDELVLLDGTTRVSFDASDRVCAQCHGEKHRDWSHGIHGLETGGWRGTVQRRLCTACHDPHAPGDIRLTALPTPELGLPHAAGAHGHAAHEGTHHEEEAP